MKKASLIAVTVLGASLLGNAAVSANALTDAANDRTTTSNATVHFKDGDKPSPTPEPSPNPAPTPSPDGPLTIDGAGSFDFGTDNAVGAGDTRYALNVTDKNGYKHGENDYQEMVQVTDHRIAGGAKGWTLTVKGTELAGKDTAGADHSVKGATISIPKPVAEAGKEGDEGGIGTPTTGAIDIALTGGDAVTVMSAKADGTAGDGTGTGLGTWVDWLGKGADTTNGGKITDGVNLLVPSKDNGANLSTDVDYTSTLTWTLNDTPGA